VILNLILWYGVGWIVMVGKHSALVIGGGIAGLQASLDLAKMGVQVHLVEREPRLGGHAPLLYKISPNMEEAEKLMKPIIQDSTQHPNVKILPYSEIKAVAGSKGNFKVRVLKKARYVDEEKCTVCGECEKVCPVDVPKEYEMNLRTRKAIYLPSPYPVPAKYLIDRETCLYFKDGSCHACKDACPENAVIYEQKDEENEFHADVIAVATGFKEYDAEKAGQYRYGVYRNVITGMEYERLCSPTGPTKGKIVRVSDEVKPKSVAYVLCVGSREEENNAYCCRIGCLAALKHAYLLKAQYGDEAEAHICYTDIRTVGKKAEEFYRKVRESGVNLVHGQPSQTRERPDKSLTMDVYDLATSKLLSITADLVVLEVGLEPHVDLKQKLKIPLDEDGFFMVTHPKLATTETPIKGIFLAGTVQQPMDIAETTAHASAAAMKALISMQK
jgi:heterodisulfide reductase subunit A